MLKKFIGILFLILVSIVLISGMSSAAQWAKTYGGVGNDIGNIWPIGDGNYYLSGFTDSFGAGKNDGLIAKLTAGGAVSWAKTFGGTADDYLSAMDLSDGGFFVSGTSKSFGTGNPAVPNNNIIFAKYNSSWVPVFQKVLGGAGEETGYFEETADGGFLFSGDSTSYGASASDYDLLLFKITSAGGLTWKKAYHYSSEDRVSDAVELSDGFLVSASVADKLSTDQNQINDILLMKLNKTTGAVIWKKLLSSASGSLESARFFKTNDGNYLIAGELKLPPSVANPLGVSNILLVKITPAGAILLSKTYASATGANAAITNIINNPDGTFVVSGSLTTLDMNTFTFTSSVLAMKLNANLSIALQKKLGNSGMIIAGITQTGTGEIMLSGIRSATMSAATDALYAKLNPTTFAPIWAKTFGGTGFDWGWLTKTNTNYLLSGYTESFGGATANKANIFGIILDANGNYPNCNVKPFTLPVGNPGLAMANITLTQTASFTLTARTPGAATAIALTKTSPVLQVKNICPAIAAPQGEALEETIEEPLDLQQDSE
jgi:hypothetical protein